MLYQVVLIVDTEHMQAMKKLSTPQFVCLVGRHHGRHYGAKQKRTKKTDTTSQKSWQLVASRSGQQPWPFIAALYSTAKSYTVRYDFECLMPAGCPRSSTLYYILIGVQHANRPLPNTDRPNYQHVTRSITGISSIVV